MSHWQFPQWQYGFTQLPAYSYYGHASPYGHSSAYVTVATPTPPAKPDKKPKAAVQAVAVQPTTVANTTAVKPTSDAKPKVEMTAPGGIAVKTEETNNVELKNSSPKEEKKENRSQKVKNAVMYCYNQSKLRSFNFEWEQISESGPPHEKVYGYQLTCGEFKATGTGKTKKDAKIKAAEELAPRFKQLPAVSNRIYHEMFGARGRGANRWRGGRGGRNFRPMKGEVTQETVLKMNDVTPKPDAVNNPSVKNPICMLYEHCKKKKWPEPIFDCVSEEILSERINERGRTLRKSNFTLRCKVQFPDINGQFTEKLYHATAITKKQAKTNASALAWNDVTEWLESRKTGNKPKPPEKVEASSVPSTSSQIPVVLSSTNQPKVVMHR